MGRARDLFRYSATRLGLAPLDALANRLPWFFCSCGLLPAIQWMPFLAAEPPAAAKGRHARSARSGSITL
jgi:hypothetical protein